MHQPNSITIGRKRAFTVERLRSARSLSDELRNRKEFTIEADRMKFYDREV